MTLTVSWHSRSRSLFERIRCNLLDTSPPPDHQPRAHHDKHTAVDTGASLVPYLKRYDTDSVASSASALTPRLLIRTVPSVPASLRREAVAYCCHSIWPGGEGGTYSGYLQLLEESECIHCASCTRASARGTVQPEHS
jgi:hypothetical protein